MGCFFSIKWFYKRCKHIFVQTIIIMDQMFLNQESTQSQDKTLLLEIISDLYGLLHYDALLFNMEKSFLTLRDRKTAHLVFCFLGTQEWPQSFPVSRVQQSVPPMSDCVHFVSNYVSCLTACVLCLAACASCLTVSCI